MINSNSLLESGLDAAQIQIQALISRLNSAEATIIQQQHNINFLQNKLDNTLRDSAPVTSVDTLRREFQQLQSTMMEHSGKVLDLLTANMGNNKK